MVFLSFTMTYFIKYELIYMIKSIYKIFLMIFLPDSFWAAQIIQPHGRAMAFEVQFIFSLSVALIKLLRPNSKEGKERERERD